MAVSRRRAATPSGRFVLRLSPDLHAALQTAAHRAGVSLNEYCVRRLSAPAPTMATDESALELLRRAQAVAGDALVGVVLHGSWTRGDATPASDVDVLVVVDTRVRLTRALYRAWDRAPVTWNGRTVDPHFVHPLSKVASGFWGEVAIDGIVLFERDLRVSRALVAIRREIAAGRLVRRVVHGHPYWTAA
jgi:predicted nucleotidyltransferase